MGVSYRDELKKNRKKRSGRAESPAGSPRMEAEERATIRSEYFRKSHVGHHKIAAAQRRLVDG